MMTRGYKAIGFDWGGVINGKPRNYFSEVIILMPGVTLEMLKDVYFNYNQAFNRGDTTWHELWKAVVDDLGFAGRSDIVDQIIAITKMNNADNLNTEMVELIDELRRNGYKVGVLSNNNIEGLQQMQRLGIDTHLDALDVSVETGFVKPRPESFLHLAEVLKVDISELIFIDDTAKSLSTAEETGFTPILFKNHEQLVGELRQLQIEV